MVGQVGVQCQGSFDGGLGFDPAARSEAQALGMDDVVQDRMELQS
jgi:hypothetical protein